MKRKFILILNFRFLNDKGTTISQVTIGNPQYFRSFKLTDGSLVNVQITDTSGQERYRALNQFYYRNADCCLLVYDISNRKSFEECSYYAAEIKERCKKNIKVILLGNKTDLKRVILSEEGANLALKNNYIFMETSCKKNKNVADAFQTLIEITNIESKKNYSNKILRSSSKIVITTDKHNKKEDKKQKSKKC